MKSATTDGWRAVRLEVFARDGGCVATQPRVFGKAVATDLCRDGYGDPIEYDAFDLLELEHVKQELGLSLRAADDVAHLVTACPWHHRLSNVFRIDSKVNRVKTRAWLARHYPEVWS